MWNNYPPGMKESDIPGWNEWETTTDVECTKCDFQKDDMEVLCDSNQFFWTCPKCNAEHQDEFHNEPDDYDYEDY